MTALRALYVGALLVQVGLMLVSGRPWLVFAAGVSGAIAGAAGIILEKSKERHDDT